MSSFEILILNRGTVFYSCSVCGYGLKIAGTAPPELIQGPDKFLPNYRIIKGPIFQFCQFFVVLHKIGHDRTPKLHGRSSKTTKKTKHGNLYND